MHQQAQKRQHLLFLHPYAAYLPYAGEESARIKNPLYHPRLFQLHDGIGDIL